MITVNSKLKSLINQKIKMTHIRFYSHHNTKINRGIVIRLYLRALEICTSKFLNDELESLGNTFT